jgi:hypothetical protein
MTKLPALTVLYNAAFTFSDPRFRTTRFRIPVLLFFFSGFQGATKSKVCLRAFLITYRYHRYSIFQSELELKNSYNTVEIKFFCLSMEESGSGAGRIVLTRAFVTGSRSPNIRGSGRIYVVGTVPLVYYSTGYLT